MITKKKKKKKTEAHLSKDNVRISYVNVSYSKRFRRF